MADISMCDNQQCPSKETCYRFKAKANPFKQVYSNFKPEKGEDKCKYYWDIKIKVKEDEDTNKN